jgi:serine/threonine protein kinase
LGFSIRTILRNSLKLSLALPLQTVAGLAFQMLERVEDLHNSGYLHMDLKPDHFLFEDEASESCLYLIDFGLSVARHKPEKQGPIIPEQHKRFIGNLLYSSIARMKCEEFSVSDDLESLVYIIGELIEGELPWRPQSQNRSEEHFRTLYSKTLLMKMRGQGWRKCGAWIKSTLNKIHTEPDAYYWFRVSIGQLLELEF